MRFLHVAVQAIAIFVAGPVVADDAVQWTIQARL